MEGFWTNKIWC